MGDRRDVVKLEQLDPMFVYVRISQLEKKIPSTRCRKRSTGSYETSAVFTIWQILKIPQWPMFPLCGWMRGCVSMMFLLSMIKINEKNDWHCPFSPKLRPNHPLWSRWSVHWPYRWWFRSRTLYMTCSCPQILPPKETEKTGTDGKRNENIRYTYRKDIALDCIVPTHP